MLRIATFHAGIRRTWTVRYTDFPVGWKYNHGRLENDVTVVDVTGWS